MNTFCSHCNKVFPSDWHDCDECWAPLVEFRPADVTFRVGTFEPVFQASLVAEPTYQLGFMRKAQAS